MTFLSDRASACINTDDDAEYEALDARRTQATLRETMRYAIERMEKPLNLTEAIDAVQPLKPDRQLIAHRFDGEFSVSELSFEEASDYMCESQQKLVPDRTYFGAIFRFKASDGGVLGLLWTQEAADWKLMSFQVIEI